MPRTVALTFLLVALVAGDLPAQDAFERAVGMFRQGLYYEAELAFREAATRQPDRGDAEHGIAMCLYLTKRFRESLSHFEAAENCSKPQAEYFVNHAVVLELLSELDAAMPLLSKGLAIDPDFVNGWFNLGKFRARLGDWKHAREALEKTLALDPAHVGAMYELAQVEFRDGNLEAAERLARRAIARDPKHVPARYLLSKIMFRGGKRALAAKLAREALRMQRAEDERSRVSQKVAGLLTLAFQFLRERKANEAVAYLKKVLELDAANRQAVHALHQIADQLDRAGRSREAAIVRRGVPPLPKR